MVEHPACGIYYGSNDRTRKGAIERHISALGYYAWRDAYKAGDRLVKVTIKKVKK
jgi:hypothetical protein